MFAPNCPKNEDGWFLFPTDAEYRKSMFPKEVMSHPAKANLFMVQAIVEYVSEVDQTVMDVMSGCYDDRTEVLTKDGWKLFNQVTKADDIATLNRDTEVIEYHHPTKLIDEPYTGKMYKVLTTQVDLVVTPDHNMFVAKRKSALPRRDWKYEILAAKDIAGKYVMYKKDAKWIGTKRESITIGNKTIPMDEWLKFFGFWLAEGHTSHTKPANRTSYYHNIGLRSSDTALIVEMNHRLTSFGYKPHNVSDDTKLQLTDIDLWKYLEPLGTAEQKYIPREYMELCSEQLEILLSYYITGDGSQYMDNHRQRPRISSFTSSSRLANDFQEIALKTNWSANICSRMRKPSYSMSFNRVVTPNFPEYRVSYLQPTYGTQVYSKFKQADEWIDYNGRIYCVEVPNHTLYVRRNGKAVWCGNTGSIMVAALIGRRVICLEIGSEYYQMILRGVEKMEDIAPGISSYITVINSDCLKVLPLPVDHIIFSPPYAQIMRMKNPSGMQKEIYGDSGALYQESAGNVGRLNRFLYNQAMEKVYKKCYDSLPVGGTLSVIIKDYIEKQKRVSLSDWVIRSCSKMGFQLDSWHKWLPPGTFFHTMREARGENIVSDEDVIVLRRAG